MPGLSYISPKAAVKQSSIHGRGLFAVEPIHKGEIVAIKGGYIFDRRKLDEVEGTLGPAEIAIADGLYIGPLHAEEREGAMIFSNHSCDPNIGVKGQIIFVAMRDIEEGEELTHDWAMTDDEDYEMECNCGSERCRGRVTGKDWMREDLQERYRGYLSWYIEEKVRRRRGETV
ncbi:MAG TPA: SET domain-containing protein-lysine N-methyltransferase [Blastocatellia bacterium]|nr:SET domain-containing protein-lysine N-methyltransferase [Blastocatellia bacterium]